MKKITADTGPWIKTSSKVVLPYAVDNFTAYPTPEDSSIEDLVGGEAPSSEHEATASLKIVERAFSYTVF